MRQRRRLGELGRGVPGGALGPGGLQLGHVWRPVPLLPSDHAIPLLDSCAIAFFALTATQQVYIWGTRKSGVPPAGGTSSAAGSGAAGGSSVQRDADNPLAKVLWEVGASLLWVCACSCLAARSRHPGARLLMPLLGCFVSVYFFLLIFFPAGEERLLRVLPG